jgi:PEP-CTERM putative exosortase interaction domain
MKNKIIILFMAIVFTGVMATGVKAATIDLHDYEYNIDGVLADPILFGDPVPAEADETIFNSTTGLGTIGITLTGAGNHFVGLYVDHEIVETFNTFFNETGGTGGVVDAGQTWEIDIPDLGGDIIANFEDSAFNAPGSALDNSIGTLVEEDVSMALGWDFSLLAGETANISFLLSEIMPLSGFYLVQNDPLSLANIYFSSTLEIVGGNPVVPEPSTVILLGLGLAGLVATRKRLGKRLTNSDS